MRLHVSGSYRWNDVMHMRSRGPESSVFCIHLFQKCLHFTSLLQRRNIYVTHCMSVYYHKYFYMYLFCSTHHLDFLITTEHPARPLSTSTAGISHRPSSWLPSKSPTSLGQEWSSLAEGFSHTFLENEVICLFVYLCRYIFIWAEQSTQASKRWHICGDLTSGVW